MKTSVLPAPKLGSMATPRTPRSLSVQTATVGEARAAVASSPPPAPTLEHPGSALLGQ
jgi:hypothetical protein